MELSTKLQSDRYKRIVGFGCSWINGDEIEHPTALPGTREHRLYREQNCILGSLANKFGLDAENHGISGGSFSTTRWEFEKWLDRNDPDDAIVLVGLTESHRESWKYRRRQNPDSEYVHSIVPPREWMEFIKTWQVNCNNDDTQRSRYWEITEFFGNWGIANNVPVILFNVFPPPMYSRFVYRNDSNLRGYMHHCYHEGHDCLAPDKHPNELGAELSAEWLAPAIEKVIKTVE